jgi:putative spermidine/putrescine transport system substrate-binding protein
MVSVSHLEEKMKHLKTLLNTLVLMSILLAACGGAATVAPTQEPAATEPAAVSEEPALTEQPAATEEAVASEAVATEAVATEEPAATEAAATEEPLPGTGEEATLVDFGYTGDIQTVLFGENLANPFMESHPGVTVELIGGISEDAIAQIKAAQGASPIDTMLLGEPRYLQAQREGWILPLSEEDIPNVADVYPNIQEHCSPGAVAWTVELIGLAYNPDLVPRPESWEDLWKPEYEGKIGMAAPSSNAGFLFLMMIGKLFGSGEGDLDTIWAKLDELGPFVVASNPEALSQLLETEEIGVAINWNTEAAVSIGKGFNVEYTMPSPGAIAQVGCYGVIAGTANPELAKEYINGALGLDFQQAMSEPPWFFAPVNKNVVLSEESARILPSPEEYANLVTIDFETALPLREGLTDQFIRDYGQ